MIYDIRLK